MKSRRVVSLSFVFLAMILTPTVAVAQTATPTPEGFQPSTVVKDLSSSAFWMALLVSLVAGAIGGVVYELLILHGNVERPHKFTCRRNYSRV